MKTIIASVFISHLLFTLLVACQGKEGPAGEPGLKGDKGDVGAKGDQGESGKNGGFTSVRTCTTTLVGANTFWDNLFVFYQVATMSSGDVISTGYTMNAGTLNESATLLHKNGSPGALDARLTLGVGDTSYLQVSMLNNGMLVVGKGMFEGQQFQYTAKCSDQ